MHGNESDKVQSRPDGMWPWIVDRYALASDIHVLQNIIHVVCQSGDKFIKWSDAFRRK
jgi:hypothetical protein